MAGFLFTAALSGSMLVWRHALDRALNPALFHTDAATRTPLSAAQLEALLNTSHAPARFRVADLPVPGMPTARATVRNWPDADPARRRTNEAYVDPFTGRLLGVRSSVNPAFNRLEFIPWLRRFHYRLLQDRNGMLLLGTVAAVWFVDCFVGIALTLPRGPERLRKWAAAWQLRPARLNYDLHRATGLWLAPMMLLLACSGVYLNLTRELYDPVMSAILSPLPSTVAAATRQAIDPWMFPLHTGEGLGWPWQVLLCCAGLCVALSIVTGLITAVRRLRRRAVD
jgi:uncharacterized iron-regulated membrane protein